MSIVMMVVLIAVILRFVGNRKAATFTFIAAVAIAYLSALAPVGSVLLRPLEQRYAPLREDRSVQSVDAIVVLGSDYTPRDDVPVTGALDGDGLARIVEGVRLFRRYQGTRLVVSGGSRSGMPGPAIGYARLAHDLGVPDESVLILSDAVDTRDEARNVAKLLGVGRFILVTSAYHMPRAMQLMQRAGARPVAAPTGQAAGSLRAGVWSFFVPRSEGLRRTERALHEYVGLTAMAVGLD